VLGVLGSGNLAATVSYKTSKSIGFPMISGTPGGGHDFEDGFNTTQHPTLSVVKPDGTFDNKLCAWNGTAQWDSKLLGLGLKHKTCYFEIPLKIEAEYYKTMKGVKTQKTTDAGGGAVEVYQIEAADQMEYDVEVLTAGTYTVTFRYAQASGAGKVELSKKGSTTPLISADLPATGSAQTWSTASKSGTFAAGTQTLVLKAATGGFNLNWINIEKGSAILSDNSNNYPVVYNLHVGQNAVYYQIPGSADNVPVTISLFSVDGSLIKNLVNERKSAGCYTLSFNETGIYAGKSATGVYIVYMRAGDFKKSGLLFHR